MNFDVMIEALPDLIGGLWLTLGLVVLALVLGFAIALPTALARLSRFAALRWVAGPMCSSFVARRFWCRYS